MAKLKNKILNSLKNKKYLENTLEDFKNYKQNLIQNHSNSLLGKKDKQKIIKTYRDFEYLENSLNRYHNLSLNNYNEEAKQQKEEIENIVLEGGISYDRYIWRAELSF